VCGPVDRLLEVRVIKDDIRALAAKLERDVLEVALRRHLLDLTPDDRRTGESDLVDIGVRREPGANGCAVAGEHVHDTRREAGLLDERAHEQRRQRRELGRLEHNCAAGRERGPNLPAHHHH
jgi:hypothetical protein